MTTLAANGYRIGDRYTLLGKLGEGGESEVWRARDHLEGREIALKVLRPEIAARPGSWEALERQHEISRRLDHPMILRIDPPVRDAEVLALPAELAPGGDLRRLCGVSYLEIVPVVMEVAQALAHAHECGVVHRDLKPGNVLFDARGHVRLADFGAAPSALSPFTASPQQLEGEPPTPADDIYGLGALAYELLSGHPPFYPHFDRRRVLAEPAPPLKPAHLAPGRLVALVMSMLGKQPHERPASMRAVLETLDMALNDTLAFAYDEPPPRAVRSAPQAAPAPAAVPPILRVPPRPAAPSAAGPRAPASVTTPASASTPAPAPTPASATTPASAPWAPASSAPPPAPAASLRADRIPETDLRALWGDIRVERVPSLMRIEPLNPSRWPWAVTAAVAAVAIALFILLHGAGSERSWVRPSVDQLRTLAAPELMRAVRGAVEAPLRAMQNARPAAEGDGAPASPQSLPGAPAAAPAGNDAASLGDAAAPNGAAPPRVVISHAIPDRSRTTAAMPRRSHARAAAPTGAFRGSPAAALAAEPLASPSGAGTAEQRGQVSPGQMSPGQMSPGQMSPGQMSPGQTSLGQASPGLGPLLSDGRDAEAARDFSRAAQDYSQALALDPRNGEARAGLNRANAAFGAGAYSQAVGSGFAALGAGRLEEAQEDFQRARSIDAHGSEAAQGLREVAAALKTRDAAAARYRARTDLESRLQAFVDNPQQLDSAASRAEAASLMREADTLQSSGPVLRSLAARLAILLPAYTKPVHLALVSDNLTEIEIPQIGSFGTFARREIDLKPGKYTVIGKRAGYREVRRDVTVAPGQTGETISVRCEVPI